MKSLILIFLLTLCNSLAFSQPSTPAKAESTTCFSNSELEAFEEAIQAETEKTVKEAVEAAVAPYKIKIEQQGIIIVRRDRTIVWLKIGLGVSLGASLSLGLYAILK